MKIVLGLVTLAVALVVVFFYEITPASSKEIQNQVLSGPAPVAVVELFTSEGCSSCPAADRLASQIDKSFKTLEKSVFVLAYHVDYWDYIGWKDRFAKPEFTERQRDYGEKFRLEGIYTPQMIVNGESQFVGSNSGMAQAAIFEALKTGAIFDIALEITWIASNQLSVKYSLSSIPVDATIQLALVEKHLINNVTRGENSGRKLEHDNVVRDFDKSDARERSERSLAVAKDINLENASVIAFIQNNQTGEIVAATSHNIPLRATN